ncbi:MAG TPA: hypothetical protein VD704_13315 [Gaiellaceae bacterium]|nr:hypothetical protein [Gaiellaceae bacterium]
MSNVSRASFSIVLLAAAPRGRRRQRLPGQADPVDLSQRAQ